MPEELHYWTAWTEHEAQVRRLVFDYGARRVCEIGGGRAPLFGPTEVESLGLEYTLLDISAEELALAPPGYRTLCADICDPALAANGPQFDLMFSKMVAEHVSDGDRMHRNVEALLRPGGVAFHFMPTLHYPAFVVNRILPHWLARWALRVFADRPYPQFPARYSKCLGPTPAMRDFLEDVGYEVVDHRPFYGSVYFERIPGVRSLERWLSRRAAQRRNPRWTSFAYLIVRKPADAVGAHVP